MTQIQISNIDSNTIIPRQILFGNPDKTSVSLSYDGKYIAYIAPKKGILNIWIADINHLESAKSITDDKDRGIRSYAIAYDNKHILYMQDTNGDENFYLSSYNIETKKTQILTEKTNVRTMIIKTSIDLPNQILIGINNRDPKYFDIYKLNLDNGDKELIFENDKFNSFVSDDNLNIRFAGTPSEDGGIEYYEFQNNKEFKFFTKISHEDSANSSLLGLDKTGDIVYMLDSRDSDTTQLIAYNLKTNEKILISQDERADIGILLFDNINKKIQATYANYDVVTYNILDETIREDMNYLQNLDRGILHINSRTKDGKKWLVTFEMDNAPIKYFLYDRDNKQAKFLFTNKKDLEKYKLAKMYPVIIKSRDDLNLINYITYPIDTKLDKNNMPLNPLPLVLYVHGGPWARDSFGYNPTHQWLANRGYAVLSVNYRGSTGFGKKFISHSFREWGGKMHDDLIDSINWTISNKIADPKKIAIMGGSYGGYATLVGMTMTPDIFACGVDIVGVSNLNSFIKTIPPYWAPFLNYMKKALGDWDTEEGREFLTSRSPINYIDNIKKPLLIAQGQHDPRVNQDESEQVVNEMNKKKIPVIYALYPDEGHGFAKATNRLSFYAMTELFLANILGGHVEKIEKDFDGANFILNKLEKPSNLEAENIINNIFKEIR
jgi:dipeptidyl aminopeptidase/acylaminoacyl peptidase